MIQQHQQPLAVAGNGRDDWSHVSPDSSVNGTERHDGEIKNNRRYTELFLNAITLHEMVHSFAVCVHDVNEWTTASRL